MSPLIAFHLPQYHPIPENDQWWGKGFTEWTNVVKATPLLPGHYQPHRPADMGYYDLRLSDSREAQAELAREYGINAFCYYHYWFHGNRLLERPVEEILRSGKPDFPFCLCWANEPWGRNWDGSEQQILMPQKYSHEDDLNHVKYLLKYFADQRYLRIDDKPVFLVYRAVHRPDIANMLNCWRDEARRADIGELLLLRVDSHGQGDIDPRPLGFDAAVQFSPNWFPHLKLKPLRALRRNAQQLKRLSWRIWNSLDRKLEQLESLSRDRAYIENNVYDYWEVVEFMLKLPDPEWKRYPCVFPMWDNTARRPRGGAGIYLNSTPELYEKYLRISLDRAQGELVFVNAWNEWAEGCHLEPCQKWGRSYLEATARAVRL